MAAKRGPSTRIERTRMRRSSGPLDDYSGVIIAALSGWTTGYPAVILVSLVQTIYIGVRTGSATSFPSQVRIVYFAYTLLGLWQAGRFYCYALLAVGTVMVVLFDRCGIALVLKLMPWNKGTENPQCKLPG